MNIKQILVVIVIVALIMIASLIVFRECCAVAPASPEQSLDSLHQEDSDYIPADTDGYWGMKKDSLSDDSNEADSL